MGAALSGPFPIDGGRLHDAPGMQFVFTAAVKSSAVLRPSMAPWRTHSRNSPAVW